MKLINILDENIIYPRSNFDTKEAVLNGLVELLNKENYIDSSADFLESVYEREHEGVTGIGNLLAIPHGKSEHVIKPGIAITTLNNKVNWESLDEEGAQIVFLIAVGVENSKAHLSLLAQIARKLSDDKINAQLLKAQNTQQIIQILTS